jgi:hypothetical protein
MVAGNLVFKQHATHDPLSDQFIATGEPHQRIGELNDKCFSAKRNLECTVGFC